MARTLIAHSPVSLKHMTGEAHIESPDRYRVVVEALRREGLLNSDTELIARAASKKRLFSCHDSLYVQLVEDECAAVGARSVAMLSTGDVVIGRSSFKAALTMVGGASMAVDAIMKSDFQNGFVIARPPGHHAERCRGMGFCLFNTVAIAARYLLDRYGLTRVAIIDWDAHHGNGTEAEFAQEPRVLFYSTHQAGIYPRTGMNSFGNVCNRPIRPGPGAREELMRCYRKELPGLLDHFQPEFLLISCGFDAHKDDPIAALHVHSEDYTELTRIVCASANSWCHGRVLSVLEGGYNLEALAECAVLHVRELSRIPHS